jgi:hypothetical protein
MGLTLMTVLPDFVMGQRYSERTNIVGAAEGCDLLTLPLISSMPKPMNIKIKRSQPSAAPTVDGRKNATVQPSTVK